MGSQQYSLVERFLNQHAALNGTCAKRQRDQRKTLLAFEDFVAPLPIEETGPSEVRAWMVKQLAGLHVNTVRWQTSMVRPFFTWLHDEGIIERGELLLIQDVKNPKGSRAQGEPKPYEQVEIQQFWAELDLYRPLNEKFADRWRQGRSRWHRTWKHAEHIQVEAITAMALYCGLRQQEVAALSMDDVHPVMEYIPVQSAKRHESDPTMRKVPYPEGARRRMERWLDFRQEINPGHDSLWLTLGMYEVHHANPLSRSSLAEMFGKIGHGWKLHRFRHTCATEWLRAGMPVEQVRRVLGHSSIDQTLAYARILPEDTLASMAKFERVFEKRIEPQFEPEETAA